MKLTIAKRMGLVIGTALMGVMIMTGISQNMTQDAYDSVNYTNINTIPSLIILAELRKNYAVTRVNVFRHVISFDDTVMAGIDSEIRVNRRNVAASFTLYETTGCLGISCISDTKDREFLSQEKVIWDQINATIDPILTESRKGAQGFSRARDLLEASNLISKQFVALVNQHFEYNADIGRRSATEATRIMTRSRYLMWLFGLLMLGTIAILGYRNSTAILKMLGGEPEQATDIAGKLALGDLSEKITLSPGDHTSLMAKINQLIDTMGLVAARADAVGNGNLSDGVAVLSDQDRLGKAINNMVVALRRARVMDQQRHWFNQGNHLLTQALTGDFSQQQVADTAISVLGHYLDAGRGALYIPRENEAILDLMGSYMHSESPLLARSVGFGEGAIGQVAREMNRIFLDIGNNADPASAPPPILTGTTSTVPRYTYTYPLQKENRLSGVLELASVTPFEQYKLDFLAEAIAIIASFLQVAWQRQKIRTLLNVAEQAERDVRQQNEHLHQVNIQMEQQQQQLLQQTEEMQQANAQMEVQQQQLLQQAEELQQSNAQLEEQHQQLQQQAEELQETNALMEEQHLLLEQTNEELRHSEAEIDEKAKQLALSNHYKSEFLANMSHELRTPLNAIMLLSKMMMEDSTTLPGAAHNKRAEIIHRSGQDLLHLINDVLDLSKVDAGHMDLYLVEISSSTIITELLDLFTSTAQQHAIRFIVEDKLQGVLISDAMKLNQILRNLLSNAFKFTKAGSVTLILDRVPTAPLPIRLCVRDTGIGIPADQQGSIFEAFRQVDGSISREYGGTGLGLTISLRLAELLGGKIQLTSTEGSGSEFTLFLPDLKDGAIPLRETPQGYGQSTTPDTAKFIASRTITDDRDQLQAGDKCILLIDDDPCFGMSMVDCNHRLGYKTIVATTAAQGLALATRYRPDGILLDLGLPDRNGADLLHDMKNTPLLAAIPVYIISASDRAAVSSTNAANAIVGYLQKPVNTHQIAHAEAALLTTIQRAPSGAILLVGSKQRPRITFTADTDNVSDDSPPGTSDTVMQLIHLLHTRITTAQHQTPYQLQEVEPGEPLQTALATRIWGVVIINLDDLSLSDGLEIARTITTLQPDTGLMFCGIEQLSDEEETSLRRYSECIIINTPHSGKRLLDNIERFLHAVPGSAPTTPEMPANKSATKRLTGRKILVIDDDPRNLFVITAALEQQDAQVINALNGRRALDILRNSSVDLIITDIMMPEMDGYHTITALRNNPAWATIPIIALTAKTLPEDRRNILEIGADDFLSKPVDYDTLGNMAACWCEKK